MGNLPEEYSWYSQKSNEIEIPEEIARIYRVNISQIVIHATIYVSHCSCQEKKLCNNPLKRK
jgi:hypothetical protein